MKKLKICVYAISKNEEKFVRRWFNSVKEADEIYVLDTGSTDKTVETLKKLGVKVKTKKIEPWRFDVARNQSLNMVPKDTDVCVCLDLDEVLLPGWRKIIEEKWEKDTTSLRYIINSKLDNNDKPLVSFHINKIHNRTGYKWKYPVHEVLIYKGSKKEKISIAEEITVNHYPDRNKSRKSYLSLLKLAIKEEPNNDRNYHYLGREYMYYKKWNECIDTLIKHLNLKSATWKEERSASMRYISRSYKALKRYDESRMWLEKAIKETPYLRDPYIEKALLEYQLNNWKEVEKLCLDALKITTNNKIYINEEFSWNETPYDLLSISYFYQGLYKISLFYSSLALEISPKDIRLIKNYEIIKNKLNSM